ncbi:MAG: hypothetical protein WBC92_08640 [Terracidiphilus sp.]
MNRDPHNPIAHESSSAEETLRLIASLPAPAGIEDRVHAALRAEPDRDHQRQAPVAEVARRGRVLVWPTASRMQNHWMRTAAAAAIVFVVVGGGWGVYSRVQQGQPARIIVMPHIPSAGGFSGAGAMRMPETVPGPVLTHPTKTQEVQPMGPKKPSKHDERTGTATSKSTESGSPAVPAGASK